MKQDAQTRLVEIALRYVSCDNMYAHQVDSSLLTG